MTNPLQPEQVEELDRILGNLTFIVSMAHVKCALKEIDTDEVVTRTRSEIAKAKAAIERLLHRSNLEAQRDLLRGFRRRDFAREDFYEVAVIERLADLQQQLTEMEKQRKATE